MKKNLPLVGFLQALGVGVYCVLISGFFSVMEKLVPKVSTFIASALILVLLVFSAAVTGLMVFGYPAYLILNKKTKAGLSVLGYTLLFCLGLIGVAVAVLFIRH